MDTKGAGLKSPDTHAETDTSDRLIAVVPKNAREEFQIQLREFKGRQFIDIRVYANNGTGIVPTPKGVAIMPNKLRAMISGLQEADRAAVEAGLIEPAPVHGNEIGKLAR